MPRPKQIAVRCDTPRSDRPSRLGGAVNRHDFWPERGRGMPAVVVSLAVGPGLLGQPAGSPVIENAPGCVRDHIECEIIRVPPVGTRTVLGAGPLVETSKKLASRS